MKETWAMIRWILPFFLSCLLVKVLNEINPFSTLICWISPAWNRVSQLIYPAVWLTFCRGLPLTGSELHGNPYFFIFYKPGLFFINALSLGNNLYSGMKKKTLTWFLWCKKIWKELVCHRSLRLPSLATSLEFFAFTLLPFLHISEDSRIILRFLNPFVM